MPRPPRVAAAAALIAVCLVPRAAAEPAVEADRRFDTARAPAARATGIAPQLERLVARPAGLTSEQAAERAAATSFDVEAERQAVLVAAAEVDRALIAYLPRVTLLASYTRLSPIQQPRFGQALEETGDPAEIPPLLEGLGEFRFPVFLDQYLTQANVVVPLSDTLLRTRPRHAAASRARRAAELDVRTERRTAALSGRLAYYDWARARLQQLVAEQSLRHAAEHLRVADARAAAGRISRADVLQAEARLAGAELLVERTRSLTAVTEDRLRTLMHDAPDASYEIGEDLFAALRVRREPVERLLEEARVRRPEIRALEQSAAAVREQRKAARAAGLPRLEAFGNAYYANPNPRIVPPVAEFRATWDVGVQVTWTLNDLGTSSAEARALGARRAQLDARRQAVRDAVRNQVFQAHQDVETARVAVEATARQLEAAEEAYRVRAELFAVGRATSLEVLDAETELLRARLELVGARIDLRVARARLDHAVGRDAAGGGG